MIFSMLIRIFIKCKIFGDHTQPKYFECLQMNFQSKFRVQFYLPVLFSSPKLGDPAMRKRERVTKFRSLRNHSLEMGLAL